MSKYTTELRYICESSIGLNKSGGYTSVNEIITKAIPKIFNFDFPIFDESYREILERKIIKHYYTREISEETVGLWKLRLDTKMNEIMPYYNQLYKSELLEFNPLYTHNLTRTHTTDINSDRATDTTGRTDSNSVTNSKGESTDLYSDTPQGSLTGVGSGTYLTNARKVNDKNTDATNANTTATTNGSDNFNSTEQYLENVSGFEGKDASELLLKYRQTFLNIDMMVINDLENLFFQLW